MSRYYKFEMFTSDRVYDTNDLYKIAYLWCVHRDEWFHIETRETDFTIKYY